ncbi:hypothetical protein CHLNCDRAFT_138220 [Chlorella variabilis]|uniref:Osmotically inducible protein C n=1 Tax=Chlorella variabilis TaxID=554065 RepID=E1Z3U6_CHLVA|nr:hypothetical protein CHLNCDRAFT_138220 [Chlorella variabilis]EFN59543.1 hypothetical protein CHLNCDRAFT_138220 [Chlorella variabilis]|eukprot:XP_005851645.1 hypothetical protein CHLNCDRAFT_138220 [Chlorella variabilis]
MIVAGSSAGHPSFRFVVDEPPRLGGKGIGPNPLSLLLGSLAGCTQFTASMIAKEMKLGSVGSVAWSSAGEYDLRGVRGNEDGVDKRCIVAATLKASGLDMRLRMKKGVVDHECEPACALHQLEEQGGGATGQVKGDPGRDADAPQFAGAEGQGRASARGFASMARRGLHSSASWGQDGEDVAREHMQADKTPQLQKETSEKGASTTSGGAYSSRDDPRAQAAPPTEGKSEKQIIQEQDAGATVHPQTAGSAEGGAPIAPKAPSPGYAEVKAAGRETEAAEAAEDEREEAELGKDIDRTDFQPWKE